MKVWLIGIGEPLVIDGENVRLRRLGNLAEYLSRQGHDVHYFSSSFDHYRKKQRVDQNSVFKVNDNYFLHVAKVAGYKSNVSISRIKSHKDSARIVRKMMDAGEKPDIILCGNTPLEMAKQVALYGKKERVQTIVDMRDLWPDAYLDVIPKKLEKIGRLYVWICRHDFKNTIKKFDSIIGVSQQVVDYGLNLAERKMGKKDKAIPIGYPDYPYNVPKIEFENKWSEFELTASDKIVAFTGNFGRQFDFKAVIDAAKILEKDDIKFVLCGTGENRENIKRTCGDNVIFPGWIEKDMITSLLQYSNIGLAPYIDSIGYHMNTPNKFGEYLSAGLPILVSVGGVMEDLLKEYKCGYRYIDAEDLARKIKMLCFLPTNEVHQNARALYEKMFQIDKVNKMFLEHFDFLLELEK